MDKVFLWGHLLLKKGNRNAFYCNTQHVAKCLKSQYFIVA